MFFHKIGNMDSSGSSSGSNSFEESDPFPKKAKPHCHKSYYEDEEENQKSRYFSNDVVSDPNSDSEGEGEGSSDDGFNDGLHEMTKKESFEYYTRVGASDGFDVPEFPNVFALGIIIPYLKPGEEFEHHESLKELNSCSKLAVDHFNMNNYANYEFVKVVKANSQAVAGAMFYITFEAKDKDKDDAPVEMFEAKVYSGIKEKNKRVLTCRPKKVTIIDEDVRCSKEDCECDSDS